jgi:hypothetical protein
MKVYLMTYVIMYLMTEVRTLQRTKSVFAAASEINTIGGRS